jgi:hypothetical protein
MWGEIRLNYQTNKQTLKTQDVLLSCKDPGIDLAKKKKKNPGIYVPEKNPQPSCPARS